MHDVLMELKHKTQDIEFTFKQIYRASPILLPITHLSVAQHVREVFPDLHVYIDAWTYWCTIIMDMGEGQYLILHRDFESINPTGFLVHASVACDNNGTTCTILKDVIWDVNHYCARISLKSILEDVMGFEAESLIICVSKEYQPFTRPEYIQDFMTLFTKYQYSPSRCPDYVHLLV